MRVSKYSYYIDDGKLNRGELCVQRANTGARYGMGDYYVALFRKSRNKEGAVFKGGFGSIEAAQFYLDEYARKYGLMTLSEAAEAGLWE